MFGLFSQQPNKFLMSLNDPYFESFQGNISGGGGSNKVAIAANVPTAGGTENFDLSVLAGLKPSQKYLGRNTVSDIQSTYQTYVTGSPVGKGGQYALASAQKYGVSIVDAARGYLIGAGIPLISSALQPAPDMPTPTPTPTPAPTPTPIPKSPFEILADVLPQLFGNAVYNPPLQSQSYGYTPTTTSQPLTGSTGGSNIGLLIILGVIGVVAYFLYKRFVK